MSKSLKKLVDIIGLKRFKSKADSAYVQTAAVDQTIAGTKTFSKPIAGSVTGSSGSCTGNAATATTAKSCTGNAATATKLQTARTIALSGAATGTATSFNGTANIAIPVTSLDASKLTGTASVSTTGNAATATTAKSCTGNAATATKLQTARTIALSGAATGTATKFDGSGNITIPVTALSPSAIRAQWYAAYPDGAEAHNAMWGGRDITAAFDAGTVSANIADGTFKDIFPGDYITKSITVPQILKADGTTEYIAQTTYTVKFIIADLDVWLNRGDTATTAHHVAIVPQSVVFNSCMNETNVTTGGYLGSFMNTNVMPAFATALQNAFGSAHILQFRFLDTKAVNNDLKSGGIVNFTGATYWGGHEWTSHYCHLMTETMVYGAPITASCAADEIMGGVQFAAFRLNSNLVYNRQNYWLSDVVSSAYFAVVASGVAGADSASVAHDGVRPFALLV